MPKKQKDKNVLKLKLVGALLLMGIVAVNAQTKKQLVGKYCISHIYKNDNLFYDGSSEEANINAVLKTFKALTPGYTPQDSVDIVVGAKKAYAKTSATFIILSEDGKASFISGDKSDPGSWKYDEATKAITTTDPEGNDDIFTVNIVKGLTVLNNKQENNTIIELTKK